MYIKILIVELPISVSFILFFVCIFLYFLNFLQRAYIALELKENMHINRQPANTFKDFQNFLLTVNQSYA